MNGLEVALDMLVQLEDRPELMLWSALFALGAFLVASGIAQSASRPGLTERLARLDVDRRLENAAQLEREGYRYPSRLRRMAPSPIARMLRPFFEDLGALVRQAVDRLAPGLISASDLERDLRLAGR